MTLEMLGMWIVVGVVAGWLAGFVMKDGMKDGRYGTIGDISLGLFGSIAGSVVFRGLEISPGAGLFMLIGVAFVGAVLAIVAHRKLWYGYA
jgi:uncharacterized membrane protein YeaQ/YmgE (transglycosylase-associated protein family)